MKWVVTDVPTWLVAVVLIVGISVFAILVKMFLNKKVPVITSGSHNDVAGFLVAVVAVVYAVIVGFTIVSLFEASSVANQDVSTEAADLLQLHDGNFVLGPTTSAAINKDVVDYADAVVNHWTTIAEGTPNPVVQTDLNDIYKTLDTFTPHTTAQEDYLSQSIADTGDLSKARVARQLEAREAGSLPLVLWLGILLTSLVTLGFSLVFGLENRRIGCLLVGGVAAVLAVNLFVLVELAHLISSVPSPSDRTSSRRSSIS